MVIDLKELEAIANGDEKFVQEMIRVFITSTEAGMLAIQSAHRENNWQQVADQAHKISSPCRHMGALHLYDLLKTLEKTAGEGKDIPSITSYIHQVQEEGKQVVLEARAFLR